MRAAVDQMRDDDTTRIERYITLAGTASGQGRSDIMVAAMDSARKLAERQGRHSGLARVHVAGGIMRTMQGDFDGGIKDAKTTGSTGTK